jgi:DNA-directed RNA polymerase specialized sigma24 family protein
MAEPGRKPDPAVAESTRVYGALIRSARGRLATIGCYGPGAVIPGVSKTAEDLAEDTLFKLYKRGWVPGAGGEDILPLGYVILKNMFTDILRSPRYRTTVSLDAEEVETLHEAITNETPQTLIEFPLIVEKMKRRLGKDEWAKKYLDALLKGAKTPKDFAYVLGLETHEVEKIRKRLEYKAKKMRDLWGTDQQ